MSGTPRGKAGCEGTKTLKKYFSTAIKINKISYRYLITFTKGIFKNKVLQESQSESERPLL